jgi:transposase-like protein
MRTRRNFSAEFKAKVVLEALSGAKSAAEICREHNLKPDLLSHWKNQFLANASKVFENGATVDPQQSRIEELEKLAGKQSLEIEILKKR